MLFTKTLMNSFTPLIPLTQFGADIYAKIEYENPAASMKFRAIPPFLLQLSKDGLIKEGTNIAIRSAGSAAIAMAWAAARISCTSEAVLPLTTPPQIVRLLKWLGTTIHQVPAPIATQMMKDLGEKEKTFVLAQVREDRLIDYYRPVAKEILQQLPDVAAITVGIGTGLSSMGMARELKEHFPQPMVYGCEPEEAPIASGGQWNPHNIPGLAPPIPQPLLDQKQLAGILTVPSTRAWERAQQVSREMGILAGPSSGCTLDAALQLRAKGMNGPIVALFACSIGEYLDTENLAVKKAKEAAL